MTFLLLLGCPEYDLQDQGKVYGASDRVPAIEVDPLQLDFPALAPGESTTLPVTIRSVGVEPLLVFGVGLSGSGAYTLVDPPVNETLEPDQSLVFEVGFTPANAEDLGAIEITSNDPDLGAITVPLSGAGLFPELVIAPTSYDFGSVPIGCVADTTLGLYNNGLAPLTVSGLAEVGVAFDVAVEGLPLTLDPGASAAVSLRFAPTDISFVEGELWVESDDPRGYRTATQTGRGTDAGSGEDDFLQADGPWERTDVVVYVDQSCSMGDDQANLAANFSQFVDALAAVEIDWQLVFAIADTGCATEGVFTADTPDLEEAVLGAVRGPGGRYTEAGLTVSDNALHAAGSTGCNAGFLREDAKTTVILVSDEPEQSPQPWDTLVDDILVAAPTTAIHSVIGDVPGGCSSAAPGTGYQEASLATGGAVLSICEGDWGSYFELIATLASSGAIASFPLSGWPDPATLEVTVDEVRSSSWTYRADLNAIEFPAWAIPPGGARIHVAYDFPADCGG